MQSVDAIVIGAGVVGLAIARAIAASGRDVLILERNARFGQETSSRNSEVIHAGLYYPPGSLKAALCVEGRQRLYAFCARREVPHRRLGKLILAADPAQHAVLDGIAASARAAGVDDLVWLDAKQVAAIEPGIRCSAALLSPSTGIVSAHDLMAALVGEAEAHGATLVANTCVSRVARCGANWLISIDGEQAPIVSTPLLVNAAGLDAQAIAAMTDGLEPAHVPALHLARGVYFACARRLPVSHLLYPVPVPGGLGTHLTLDLDGRARFGPDVEWVSERSYHVDAGRRATFLAAARLIWPALEADDLVPAYAGIRPKISGPHEPAADFVISTPRDHGLDGLVNLFGIESPGLTASLAIADRVATALAIAA